jgi:hypothetical protein
MLNINTFWLQIDFITCILCSHAFYQINMNNFCYNHIFEIHNFQSQFSTFEPNVLKWVLKKQFKRNGEHLVKKGHLKKTRTIDSWGLSALNMKF